MRQLPEADAAEKCREGKREPSGGDRSQGGCDCVIRADLDKSTNKKAIKLHFGAFPGGPVVKNLPASGQLTWDH